VKKPRKPRGSRPCLTHIEVRRGSVLRLRIAIADEAIGEVGDELGALLRKVTPGAQREPSATALGSIAVATSDAPSDFVISPVHEGDDDAYHAALRERLAELLCSLCDASLSDALEIAHEERSRRVDVN